MLIALSSIALGLLASSQGASQEREYHGYMSAGSAMANDEPEFAPFSVALGGDVDGDGFGDVAVGCPLLNDGGPCTGKVVLISCKTHKRLFEVRGQFEKQCFGFAVAFIGDWNGDKHDDLAVGAVSGGRVTIVSGKDGSTIRTLQSNDPVGDSWFGIALANVSDLDGDGIPELAVGAPRTHERPLFPDVEGRVITSFDAWDACGAVYVFSSRNGALVRELRATNHRANSFFGRSLASAGDVDGDGTNDLIVGAPGVPVIHCEGFGVRNKLAERTAMAYPDVLDSIFHAAWQSSFDDTRGRAFVFSGKDGHVLRELALDQRDAAFGCSVANAGDLDHDGFADVAVGAHLDNSAEGKGGSVHIYSGHDGSVLRTLRAPGEKCEYGWSLALGHDADGDGTRDLYVGDALAENRMNSMGRVELIASKDGTTLTKHDEGDPDDCVDDYGYSIATGDIDADGVPDLAVVALRWIATGEVYVYSGRTGACVLSAFQDGTAGLHCSTGRH